MTREEIINNIRKEGLNIGKNDVLIGIMPTQIQSIVLAYHRYENYVPDFLITSLLSAAATAIGNSFRLRIKGLWTTNPALYIVLFGKPGLGKQDIEIRPKVSGFITKLCVDEGSTVKQGQPLFMIDRVQYEAQVKSAKASVEVAKASLNTMKLTVENKRELHKRQIISDFDLQTALDNLASAEAQLAQAKANLTNALEQLSYCTVVSPSNGVVGEIPYRVGSLVSSASATPLTTVSNIAEMYVYFSMTEKQLLEMTRNSGNVKAAISQLPSVKLKLTDGTIYAYDGKVETVSGVIDQNTGSVSMRATFPNPKHELRSGRIEALRHRQVITEDLALFALPRD